MHIVFALFLHIVFLRPTMSLTMVVSKDTYLWTLEVYYRYMNKLIYPSTP